MKKLFSLLLLLALAVTLPAQGHYTVWHQAKVILKSNSFDQESNAEVILNIDDIEGVVDFKVMKDGVVTPIKMSIRDIKTDSLNVKYKLSPKAMLVTTMTDNGELCKLTIYNPDLEAVWRKAVFLFYM